jgi:sugar lactone lactonase YvrE
MKVIASVAAAVLLAGCGNGTPPDSSTADEDRSGWLALAPADSIGVELGDSCYMFSSIQNIAHGPDGLVYVLDRAGCNISVYSPDGEFVRRFSREGSGPGELINPLAMAVVGDGRIFVCSPWNGGIHAFSPEGEWQGLVTEFTNNPPMIMTGTEGNAYVAFRLQVEPEGDEIVCTTFIGRYEEGEEPEVMYWIDEFPFDPLDITTLLKKSYFGNVFSVDSEGYVFISPLTSEEYLVEGFSPDGERFLEITAEAVQVAKSDEEIREEKFYVETLLESYGASGVVIDYEPDPFRNTISDIDADSQGRLWVRRGTERTPVFDVYDYDGELLFTAHVPSITEDGDYWDFTIDEYAIMAFSANPEIYQKIYLLELPVTPSDRDL